MAKNSGINRTIDIPQPSIFGRVGTGIGQGLAEQIPKEIERQRFVSGLQDLEREGANLNPQQYFTRALQSYGLSEKPQIVQSLADLARQQNYLNALKNQFSGNQPIQANEGNQPPQTNQQNQPNPKQYIPKPEDLKKPVQGEIPTLATPEATQQSYKEYIPPTDQQERQDAYTNFQNNPARYNFDFENALKERKAITARNQEIQKAYQGQEATAVAKEEKLKGAFDKEASRLGIKPIGDNANFDPKLYQMFEERLLNSILPKSQGGEGLTQEQATKKYSEQLREAFRNYQDLGTLSSWSPSEFNRKVNAIQKNFSHFGQPAKQVIMDRLIAEQKVSPSYAAHKAYPINKGEMPTLNNLGPKIGTGKFGVTIPQVNDGTYSQLKKEMGKSNSPLSIAYELDQKSQDPRGWLKYLDNHRDDLEVWQADQLTKNINIFDLKDIWLRAWE